jgi:hypothetical protein
LAMSIGHRPGARRTGPADQKLEVSKRHVRECRKLLMLQLETQVLGIERHGATHVLDLISRIRPRILFASDS